MILVDTSVVVEYARTGDAKLEALFRTLPVAVCPVTRAEVLHGSRGPGHRQNVLTLLNAFHQVPIQDALWDTVGDHLATLRGAGISVSFADAVIATVAVEGGLEHWTRDGHFALMQAVVPQLRLFLEPP
jgi:predicted nucleic acid-binding protein